MRVIYANKSVLEKALFDFLLSVRNGKPEAKNSIATDNKTLAGLYENPHPDLCLAMKYCIQSFLSKVHYNPEYFGKIKISSHVFGLTLALNNCLAPVIPENKDISQNSTDEISESNNEFDKSDDFTKELIMSLPSACNRDLAIAYHSILNGSESILENKEFKRKQFLHTLIELSPLTSLAALNVHMPEILNIIAKEVLFKWKQINMSIKIVWKDLNDWLNPVLLFIDDPYFSIWLRKTWLEIPENRNSCRNIGLVLEVLKRQKKYQDFILEFYESYDYFSCKTINDDWYGQLRYWPVIKTIENLISVPASNEAAIKLHRRGNEYFYKFRPVIDIIIAEKKIPDSYEIMALLQALRPLMNKITESTKQNVSFGDVEF
ncbi:MAG: hypothetical protein OMM_03180 [Candidatus Magnetoglobus multicellularis str. Araruama]|uniref:Uncharacterized protein n=1 Tax=Candidatus Magnetoglobus multicellularis str. Araruama TaxID=890399 RepID=A0A1V1P6W3_9BACT|nr:MAG: hypothetical protein OMM_03180 [Candidatus Magnetoglobus multicellularis str. Araruama]